MAAWGYSTLSRTVPFVCWPFSLRALPSRLSTGGNQVAGMCTMLLLRANVDCTVAVHPKDKVLR